MPDIGTSPDRGRMILKALVAVAAAAFALTASRETARVVMIGLLAVAWLTLIVMEQREQREGRTLGMQKYIWILGAGLLVMLLLLLFGP